MTDKNATPPPAAARLIALAEAVGVHGIKGAVKLKVFAADPEGLAAYNPLSDAAGQTCFTLKNLAPHGNIFLAFFDGINDRTAAEKLRGQVFYTARKKLPALKNSNSFYHVDLIGLRAETADGDLIGHVLSVANFGAGDLLEIKPVKGASFYLPFTAQVVPQVQLEQQRLLVVPPPGLIDPPAPGKKR